MAQSRFCTAAQRDRLEYLQDEGGSVKLAASPASSVDPFRAMLKWGWVDIEECKVVRHSAGQPIDEVDGYVIKITSSGEGALLRVRR